LYASVSNLSSVWATTVASLEVLQINDKQEETVEYPSEVKDRLLRVQNWTDNCLETTSYLT